MLLCQTPDPGLTSERLERVARDLCAAALGADAWHFRELYVDRGRALDPFYLLDFKAVERDSGDFVYDQPLFATRYPGLRLIRLTHLGQGPARPAWETLSGAAVAARVERFMDLYRRNKLQPPGRKQGWTGSIGQPHDTFDGRRFLFHLRSPVIAVAGIGPAQYAGAEASLCGQVLDAAGQPAGGVVVELLVAGQVIRRSSSGDGHFWFSRIPPGQHTLRLPGRVLAVRIVDRLPYGHATGTVRTTAGVVVTGQQVELEAPDGELFPATTGGDGRFDAGHMPPFTYRLRVPPFMFSASVSYVVDSEIGGNLVDEDGAPLAGVSVVLAKDGTEVATRTTDTDGRFAFTALAGGRYALRVPGRVLYLRSASGAGLRGKLEGAVANQMIELVARGEVVARQAIDAAGRFQFDNLPGGSYGLRAPGWQLARKGAR